jgi:nucleotide-binding universal stress UspA family protein
VKILTAVDFSDPTDMILRVTSKLAKRLEARVWLLHVAEPEPDFVGYNTGPDVVRGQVANEYREEHRAIQKLADSLREAGVDATALLIQGPTVETTLKQSRKLDVDLIVVGSHGHSAIYDVLVGSYSAGILRKSDVPVMVVPTRSK